MRTCVGGRAGVRRHQKAKDYLCLLVEGRADAAVDLEARLVPGGNALFVALQGRAVSCLCVQIVEIFEPHQHHLEWRERLMMAKSRHQWCQLETVTGGVMSVISGASGVHWRRW